MNLLQPIHFNFPENEENMIGITLLATAMFYQAVYYFL
jgi:hypothetical protein